MSGWTTAKLKAHFRSAFPGRDWDQSCQAAVAWACQWTSGKPVYFYDSANVAYRASKFGGRDASKAPVNAIHYFSIGKYGHVAGGLGGSRVFMASKHIDIAWAENLGETTVERYVARTGAIYLGWCVGNGTNRLLVDVPAPKPHTANGGEVARVAKYLNKQGFGMTTTASKDDKRGPIYWTLAQTWGSQHDSAGRKVARPKSLYPAGFRIDGDPGTRSKTIEAVLRKVA